MKQRVLNAAILTALGLGMNATAFAAADQTLTNGAETTDEWAYADQISPDTDLDFPTSTTFDVGLGFGISNGDERFIRIDILNAAFRAGQPDAASFACTTSTVASSNCQFALGQTGDGFIVISLSAAGANLDPSQRIMFNIGDGVDDADTDAGSVQLQYRLYEDPIAAAGGGADGVIPGTEIVDDIIDFVDGLFTDSEFSGTCTADVEVGSVLFTGSGPVEDGRSDLNTTDDDTCRCGSDGGSGIDLLAATQTIFNATGGIVGSDSVFRADGSPIQVDDIVNSADFNAMTTDSFAFADDADDVGVYLVNSTSSCGTQFDGDAVIDTDMALFEDFTSGTSQGSFGGFSLCLENTTGEEFPVSTISGSLDLTANTGYRILRDRDLGDLCSIDKNGSEDNLIFSLSQGGFYGQFVRVTNPTSRDGRVFLTCYDDFGNDSRHALGEFLDRDGDTIDDILPAHASTDLINIDEVWDVCSAMSDIDPTAGGPGSQFGDFLRLRAEGEFGDNSTETTGQGEVTGIRIEGVTVSRTGESFENLSR